jgi:hypothetical protein
LLTHHELGIDPQPALDHFRTIAGEEETRQVVAEVQREISSPFSKFDAIYCINLDRQSERWTAMQRRFEKFGIQNCVRRMPAADTPSNSNVGCALSHRRILEQAKRQGLRNVLVFEDDARFTADAPEVLAASLRELEGRDWQFLYLGGHRWSTVPKQVPGCCHIAVPDQITCTHALAYHESVYDAILNAVPEYAVDVQAWLTKHGDGIDQFYQWYMKAVRFVTDPVIATQNTIICYESRTFEE